MNTSDTGEHGDYLRRLDDRADAAAVHAAEIAREESRSCKKCGERLKEPTERGVCGTCADENINGINSQVADPLRSAAEIEREESRSCTPPIIDMRQFDLAADTKDFTIALEALQQAERRLCDLLTDETGTCPTLNKVRAAIQRLRSRQGNAQVADPLRDALNDFAKVRGAL